MEITVKMAHVPPKFKAEQKIGFPYTLDVPEETTGHELMKQLQMNPELPSFFVVNDEVVLDLSRKLQPHDEIMLLYIVGGG